MEIEMLVSLGWQTATPRGKGLKSLLPLKYGREDRTYRKVFAEGVFTERPLRGEFINATPQSSTPTPLLVEGVTSMGGSKIRLELSGYVGLGSYQRLSAQKCVEVCRQLEAAGYTRT